MPEKVSEFFDGENLPGRLPEFKLSGHMKNMFGDGFMGVSSDSLTTLAPMRTVAMRMRVDVS